MLISSEQLRDRLQKPDLVLFDCRFHLSDPAWGKQAYLEGHLPNAIFLDLEQDLAGTVQAHGGRHPLPDSQQLANRLGACGVGANTLVVVYDAGEGMATHAWWLIRYLGHRHVCVLDGGINHWLAAGFPLSTKEPVAQAKSFPLAVQDEWLVGREEVMQIVAGKQVGVLVDARSAERYRGEVEPLDPVAGHIPGAVNVPWLEGITPEGKWADANVQKQRFAAMVKENQPMIAYCGSGVTACANLFAMHLAGIEDAKLYAGSWSDWVSYANAPVAKEIRQDREK